jgi:hypothetical protein
VSEFLRREHKQSLPHLPKISALSLLAPPHPIFSRTTSSTSTNTTKSTASRIMTSTTPRKNKPYLYIALYARGDASTSTTFHSSLNCDAHHWALIVGSRTCQRSDPGTRYHISHDPHSSTSPYAYEETNIQSSAPASAILVRIAVAKVRDVRAVEAVVRNIPIPTTQQDSYTCLSFVRDAFSTLHSKENRTTCLRTYLKPDEWIDVEGCARRYIKRKRELGRLNAPVLLRLWANYEIIDQVREARGVPYDRQRHVRRMIMAGVSPEDVIGADGEAERFVHQEDEREDEEVEDGGENEVTPMSSSNASTLTSETAATVPGPAEVATGRRDMSNMDVICTYNFWENRELMF